MTMENHGIKVALILDEGDRVEGFASGAESPNDFWSKFKTQCVRVDGARFVNTRGETSEHRALYVNRDRIRVAKIVTDHDDSFGRRA